MCYLFPEWKLVLWLFLHWHWACSKRKVEHMNEPMQNGNLKLLGLVLYISMFVGLALVNCCHFHQVKVLDKFYRRLLSAKGSGHRTLISGIFRANILQKLKSSEKSSFLTHSCFLSHRIRWPNDGALWDNFRMWTELILEMKINKIKNERCYWK